MKHYKHKLTGKIIGLEKSVPKDEDYEELTKEQVSEIQLSQQQYKEGEDG